MSDKNPTAVGWLVVQMQTFEFTHLDRNRILQQALEMEKQQIIDAHSQGIIEAMTTSYLQECDIEPMSEQYYTETFKP